MHQESFVLFSLVITKQLSDHLAILQEYDQRIGSQRRIILLDRVPSPTARALNWHCTWINIKIMSNETVVAAE
jgi:hypothetical protein